jgi:hypothetical protein
MYADAGKNKWTQQGHFRMPTRASSEKPDNEEADRMAKEGAVEVPPNRFTAIRFSVGEKLIKKHLELQHQACTGCRLSKMLMRFPISSRASELRQIVDWDLGLVKCF